jgi:hypothetical protein
LCGICWRWPALVDAALFFGTGVLLWRPGDPMLVRRFVSTSIADILPSRSAERERKSLHARIEKLDLELSISDGLRLSDQLIQPLFGR